MEALKFLRPGRVAPFTAVTWPPPGQWLASAAPPELCRAGVHALLPDALATWTTEELWRVELDGARELAPGIMVAWRGRLLGRVIRGLDAGHSASARQLTMPATARERAGNQAGRTGQWWVAVATKQKSSPPCLVAERMRPGNHP